MTGKAASDGQHRHGDGFDDEVIKAIQEAAVIFAIDESGNKKLIWGKTLLKSISHTGNASDAKVMIVKARHKKAVIEIKRNQL